MRAALALFALLSVSSLAQTPAMPKSFLIADVHPSPFSANPFMHGDTVQGDRYFLTQATMIDLIANAYGVDGRSVQGGPPWLERDRFDLRAQVPARTTPEDLKLMLRGLLAERFHLVVKTGTAAMPTYLLTAGPGKPKMTEAEGTGEGACNPLPEPANAAPGAPSYLSIECKGLTMAALAETLRGFAGGYLNLPVVDKTNLPGTWGTFR